MITSLENIISMRATRLKDDRTTWIIKGLSAIRIRDRVNFYARGGRKSRYVNNGAIFSTVLGRLTSHLSSSVIEINYVIMTKLKLW